MLWQQQCCAATPAHSGVCVLDEEINSKTFFPVSAKARKEIKEASKCRMLSHCPLFTSSQGQVRRGRPKIKFPKYNHCPES